MVVWLPFPVMGGLWHCFTHITHLKHWIHLDVYRENSLPELPGLCGAYNAFVIKKTQAGGAVDTLW